MDVATITDQYIEEKVLEAVADSLDLDVSEVTSSSSLVDELGAESLDFLDISFSLEREFQVSMPSQSIFARLDQHYGIASLVKDGLITDLGLRILKAGIPGIAVEKIKPGLKATDVTRSITPKTFVHIIKLLLVDKKKANKTCPKCSSIMNFSDSTPELCCPNCAFVNPLRSGDDVFLDYLMSIIQ